MYGYDGDSSINDSAEMRLHIAQQAQAAAADANSGMFACPYCDKQYLGKHARSIWRRHLQDKHSIPLSQQPRRTRWDGDANRPKNAEERRQRMLESKRRWARKKRMQDKRARIAGADRDSMEPSMEPSDDEDDEDADLPEENDKGSEEMSTSPLEGNASKPARGKAAPPALAAPAVTATAAPKAAPAKKRREPKPKGPQQIKFHHVTTTDMPAYGEHGAGGSTGPTVWTFADGKPTTGPQMGASAARMAERAAAAAAAATGNHQASVRILKREASAPAQKLQTASMLKQAPASPRRAFGEVDTNAANGRGLARSVSAADNFQATKGRPGAQMDPYGKLTPVNRFAQLHPTPPSATDDKTLGMAPLVTSHSSKATPKLGANIALLSPPSSQHTAQTSPTQLSGGVGGSEHMASKRMHATSGLSPTKKRVRVDGAGVFSLDHHKISPPGAERRMTEGAFEPPLRHMGVSPLQKRKSLQGDSASALNDSASPLREGRRLPPLVKTPMRPARLNNAPTPDNAMGLMTELGASSVRRKHAKTASTPQSSRMERLLGGSTSIGLTPFDAAKMSANYSVSRGGLLTRPSPLKREPDQFSSPQHLNLTQSLGLAPHSTMKGSSPAHGGIGSVGATPFINSFLNSTSPWTRDLWPDSVLRPSTYRTSASQRGSPSAGGSSATSRRMRSNDGYESAAGSQTRGAIDGDDDDEDDDDDGPATYLHETPSRPAKMRQAPLLGSPTSSQRSRRIETGGASGSSACKGDAHAADVGAALELQPIRFRPSQSPESARKPSSSGSKSQSQRQRFGTPSASFDGELLAGPEARPAGGAADATLSSSPPPSSPML